MRCAVRGANFCNFVTDRIILRAFSTESFNAVFPIHFEIPMPKLDADMRSGTLTKWHVEIGDEVESGTPLFDMKMITAGSSDADEPPRDAATWRITSNQVGIFARRFAIEGQILPAAFPVGLLVEDDFDIEAFGEAEYMAPDLVEWQDAPACRKRGSLRFNLDSSIVEETMNDDTAKKLQPARLQPGGGMQLNGNAARLLQDSGGSGYWGTPSNEPSNHRR
jgi:hypothetical protein